MDDGIKELAQMAVDFARWMDLNDDEEIDLLDLVATAYRAGMRAYWEGLHPLQMDDIYERLVGAKGVSGRKPWVQ